MRNLVVCLFSLILMLPVLAFASHMLPESFTVYTAGDTVANHSNGGSVGPVTLPTDNTFQDDPGCYVACYTKDKGVYSVGGGIQVLGQVRVAGKYVGRVCRPTGNETSDISAMEEFKSLCNTTFATCENAEGGCWAGGDTGGWFGISR